MSADGYPVPAAEARVEIEVKRSRFIGLIGPAPTVEAAREFIDRARQQYPDASHHVYAFAAGYGSSVTHGMSDDGEPSGTAGRPALTVVSNAELGDVVVVVVRYFGGTKLGTGGLVRAYTQATQEAIAAVPRQLKTRYDELCFRLPYERYDLCRAAIARAASIEVVDEQFGADTRIHLRGPEAQLAALRAQLVELTAGTLDIED